MDFRTKLSFNVLAQLPKAKFSIRLSILSIVLILLIGISVVIIGINYFTLNSILVESSKNYLSQSSGKVSEQIRSYLNPLNSNISIAYRMFSEGVVDPKKPEFTRFLYGLIADNKNLVGAYWGDINGNWYWLNREADKGFIEEVILRDGNVSRVIKKNLDAQGNILTTKKSEFTEIDPRSRPWYQQAQLRKHLTWVIYRFVKIGSQETQLGITSAFPVYDAKGNLKGVLGIDMLLGAIANYVKDIKLTENSFIFVIDEAGYIIAAHAKHGDLLKFDKLPEVTNTKGSWLQESFKIYQHKRQSPFVYSSGGQDYVSSYEKILDGASDDPWFVAIVTPMDDIIAPLRKNVLVGTFYTGVVLLIGIFLASVFASSLSRPIRRLAQDANLICLLKLESIRYLFSRIKEVAEMADSFIKMKNALYSFQRYMPITLVKKLILSNKIATVGGESKDLTLLFTDIKNFTQLSESFIPEELMRYLSEYFQCITKIILDVYGTVDKYVGDGVVAFWGAPIDDEDHTLHACLAAVRMQQSLQQLNLKWRAENKPEVVTRIGISSGRVIVGNVGSDDRLSYTSLGDPVNLASRLEELNKIYGTTAMVSEFIYEKVKDKFKFRLLDRVAVKGKKQEVYVYELLGELNAKEPDLKLEQYNKEFYQAFSSYENGDWQTAINLFNELDKKYPSDHVIKIFIDRCTKFIAKPPAAWNGIWIMSEK